MDNVDSKNTNLVTIIDGKQMVYNIIFYFDNEQSFKLKGVSTTIDSTNANLEKKIKGIHYLIHVIVAKNWLFIDIDPLKK